MKTDIYQRITDQMSPVSKPESARGWKPWSGEHAAGRITRPLRENGIPYRGINILMLWGTAMERGIPTPIWMTFKQALELGGCVRKGQSGPDNGSTLVVFSSKHTKGEGDEEREYSFLRGYPVFNVEQIDGLPAHYLAPAAPRIERQRAFVANVLRETPAAPRRRGYAHSPAKLSRSQRPFDERRRQSRILGTLC